MRTFYRNVRAMEVDEADFLSTAARGRPEPEGDESRRVIDGISVWETLQAAQQNAARYRRIGRFIARLDIPDESPMRIEKTFANPAHYTIWAEPRALLHCVSLVVPARSPIGR